MMGRLIDTDKLKADLEKEISKNEDMDCLDFLRAASAIDAQPTAYDPKKVVKQLEEFRTEMEQFGCGGMMTDIIDVVKAGGADAEH